MKAAKTPQEKPKKPVATPKKEEKKIKVSKNEAEFFEKFASIFKKSGMSMDDLSKKTKLAKAQLPKEAPGKTSPSFRNMIAAANALGYEISLKKIKVEK